MDIVHATNLLAKVFSSAAIVLGLSAIAERVSLRIAGILAGALQAVVLVYFFVGRDMGIQENAAPLNERRNCGYAGSISISICRRLPNRITKAPRRRTSGRLSPPSPRPFRTRPPTEPRPREAAHH
jgi:hypothetical protein